MKTLTIQLPDSVNEQEAKNMLAAKLYESGELSLGQAATLAGYSKESFMELLSKYGVAFFNYTPADLASDLANAQNGFI